MGAQNIPDVLERLDRIVDDARRTGSRLGYFAALYREVTAAVARGIDAGRFEDGARMARFDVTFASRYLDAYDAYCAGRETSRSWRLAFDATDRWPPLVLQHLLLGMNAHITLDLGVAAADTCPGDALPSLARDFREINALLGELVDDVQDRIARISPWMWILDRVGGRTDERVCGFCMDTARDLAWRHAERLAPLNGAERDMEIDFIDLAAEALAMPILRPPGMLMSAALLGVRLREVRDVGAVIDALDSRRH